MRDYENLTDILRDNRDSQTRISFIHGQTSMAEMSVAELWTRALNVLGDLQRRGLEAGAELIIYTRSNEEFLTAFWAAVLGGIVPVPVAVGSSPEHQRKLLRIYGQLGNAMIYTDLDQTERLLALADSEAAVVATGNINQAFIVREQIDVAAAPGDVIEPEPEATAFIQYSSGSTSDPKGIRLSHANLAANIAAIVAGADWRADDRSLSWMPLTHDMGLIGYHLSVLAAGMEHAVMDTALFVRRPLLWLQQASARRSTQLCSPNFGYKHFLKVYEHKGCDGLDLSAVRMVMNGAEPISWDLCTQFLDAMAPHGLERTAMFPVYGLAEATVAVSFPRPGEGLARIVVDRHHMNTGRPCRFVDESGRDAVSFVKVGRAVADCELRIVDDEDQPLPASTYGHIQIRGANVTTGFYDGSEQGLDTFTDDGWLRTGDCGVLVDDDLVITGRIRDIVIVNGQNYYAHDIEEAVHDIDGLELGKVVVAGARRAHEAQERLLVFVLFRRDPAEFAPLARAVRKQVATVTGLEVDSVIPVTRIPKTTSGKVQRRRLAESYLDGEFDEVADEYDSEEPTAAADALLDELQRMCRRHSGSIEIGYDDNLFEVGISSLTLTEIVLAIDQRYPGVVDIDDLFDHPTLRDLAKYIQSQ